MKKGNYYINFNQTRKKRNIYKNYSKKAYKKRNYYIN